MEPYPNPEQDARVPLSFRIWQVLVQDLDWPRSRRPPFQPGHATIPPRPESGFRGVIPGVADLGRIDTLQL